MGTPQSFWERERWGTSLSISHIGFRERKWEERESQEESNFEWSEKEAGNQTFPPTFFSLREKVDIW